MSARTKKAASSSPANPRRAGSRVIPHSFFAPEFIVAAPGCRVPCRHGNPIPWRRRRGPRRRSGGHVAGSRRLAHSGPVMTLLRSNELLEKLIQIHEQAELTLAELPKGLAKDRLRLIVGLAKYLKNAAELERDPSNPGS